MREMLRIEYWRAQKGCNESKFYNQGKCNVCGKEFEAFYGGRDWCSDECSELLTKRYL